MQQFIISLYDFFYLVNIEYAQLADKYTQSHNPLTNLIL